MGVAKVFERSLARLVFSIVVFRPNIVASATKSKACRSLISLNYRTVLNYHLKRLNISGDTAFCLAIKGDNGTNRCIFPSNYLHKT